MVLHGQLCGRVGRRRKSLKHPFSKESGCFCYLFFDILICMDFDYTENELRAFCTDNVYARGEEYLNDGMVTHLAWRGDMLCAEVEGSDDKPYSLSVQFDNGHLSSASCSCPYEYEGWCKHIIAALMMNLEDPDCAKSEIPLQEILKPLSKQCLHNLILNLTQEHPAIYRTIVEILD